MKRLSVVIGGAAAAGLLALTVAPGWAHHAFSAEYDSTKPLTLRGTVTKVEWINPHVHFYMDVMDQTGAVAHWACQVGSPNALQARGWKRGSLKVGDSVSVRAYRAKAGTNLVNARSVQLSSGAWIFAGSSGDFGPER